MADRRNVAREGLQRTKPFTLLRAAAGDEDVQDGLTLRGHAAVFNETTLIDSWEGRFYEQLLPGAFRKTFRERTPVLQFDHGLHPLVGSIPIGKVREAREDDEGAYVQARLHDNWLVQPVRDAIAEESITGMSFRFTVVREEWRREDGTVIKDDAELLAMLWAGEETPTRSLKEVKVPELGPVVFPAYSGTDVDVRSGRTVIDLAALRSNPEERKKLARALFLAEDRAGTPQTTDSAPPDDGHPKLENDAPPSSGHPSQPQETTQPNRAAQDAADMRERLARIKERTA